MDFVKIYGTYIKMFLRSRAEYRMSFFMSLFAQWYCTLIGFAGIWVMAQSFGTIGGWNFNEMVVLYGLGWGSGSVAGLFLHSSVMQVEFIITRGELDSYLIRPMGIIRQLSCRRLADQLLGNIVIIVMLMAPALISLAPGLTAFNWLFLVLGTIGGTLIHAAFMIFFGSISFWMLRSRMLTEILYYDLRNFTNYPLNIFPNFIKFVLTFVVPLGLSCYYPSLIILNKAQTGFDFWLGCLSPVLGLVLCALAVSIFHRGLRRYAGTGS